MGTPKFPDVEVELSNEDGNAAYIIAKVSKALRRAGLDGEVAEYVRAAKSGDYDNVLRVTMKTVTVI